MRKSEILGVDNRNKVCYNKTVERETTKDERNVKTMKVKELMEMLSKMDGEMDVRVEDRYWINEGYYDTKVSKKERWQDEHPIATKVVVKQGSVLIL